jgi:Raf kinase inhibitor-like YbhB/YbcL family protein
MKLCKLVLYSSTAGLFLWTWVTPVAAQSKNTTAFHLAVSDIPSGSAMPRRFTCDGKGISPAVAWSGEPEGTQSFAIIVDDQDAGDFNHWLLWDIPASVHAITEGASPEGTTGTNDFGKRAYGGPCPPEGRVPHRYSFRVMALDVPSLSLPAKSHRDVLDKALKKHVLAKAEYLLQYGRN